MNKKLLSGIILVSILVIGLVAYFIGRRNYLSKEIKPGVGAISTQRIAIVYHPINQGIIRIADIIKSRVGGDVYTLEPYTPYPSNPAELKTRITYEQKHPEKIVFKNNNFDIKKYHIIFIGAPVLYNQMSPIMMRFVMDIEPSMSEKYITIPFVYYEGRDEAKETYKYIYSYTKYSTRKNGYTSTLLDKQANEMYIDLWLNDINFYRYELEDVKDSSKNASSSNDKKVKKSIFKK